MAGWLFAASLSDEEHPRRLSLQSRYSGKSASDLLHANQDRAVSLSADSDAEDMDQVHPINLKGDK